MPKRLQIIVVYEVFYYESFEIFLMTFIAGKNFTACRQHICEFFAVFFQFACNCQKIISICYGAYLVMEDSLVFE
jgi:hypothetical protein